MLVAKLFDLLKYFDLKVFLEWGVAIVDYHLHLTFTGRGYKIICDECSPLLNVLGPIFCLFCWFTFLQKEGSGLQFTIILDLLLFVSLEISMALNTQKNCHAKYIPFGSDHIYFSHVSLNLALMLRCLTNNWSNCRKQYW